MYHTHFDLVFYVLEQDTHCLDQLDVDEAVVGVEESGEMLHQVAFNEQSRLH